MTESCQHGRHKDRCLSCWAEFNISIEKLRVQSGSVGRNSRLGYPRKFPHLKSSKRVFVERLKGGEPVTGEKPTRPRFVPFIIARSSSLPGKFRRLPEEKNLLHLLRTMNAKELVEFRNRLLLVIKQAKRSGKSKRKEANRG